MAQVKSEFFMNLTHKDQFKANLLNNMNVTQALCLLVFGPLMMMESYLDYNI